MKLFIFAVSFLLAFLLFAVQPMATKLVLPVLGGSPAVWNTAMLLFQLLLLAGYFYAYVLTRRFSWRVQLLIHALLIAGSFLLLPLNVVLPSSDAVIHHPIYAMSRAFLLQLGLPFFMLSATAPLLQSWVSKSNTSLAQTPYVLYSASNLGSFLALIGYVIVIESSFDLTSQRYGWSVLYILGAVALLAAGYRLQHKPAHIPVATPELVAEIPLPPTRYLTWIGLAFLPSALSLSVTSYITTDIAAVPLLWVIPLALYLLSFVDAFRTRPWLVSSCMRLAPLMGLIALMVYSSPFSNHVGALLFHLATFTVFAFALHGYLARRKPGVRQLTLFYFCLSIGGALGGIFNALIAPLLFNDTFEYPLIVAAASLCAFACRQPALSAQWKIAARMGAMVAVFTALLYGIMAYAMASQSGQPLTFNRPVFLFSVALAALLLIAIERRADKAYWSMATATVLMLITLLYAQSGQETLFKARNFFGVQKVTESAQDHARYFIHNTTLHGVQSLDKAEALHPFSYYAALAEIFDALPVMRADPMAIVGLGVGTAGCYAAPYQPVDFFDINPLVMQIANDPQYFTYLHDCPGVKQMLLGDGRIKMAEQKDSRYGAVILDVFSSDSIPTHLLTQEAFTIYLSKLAPHGVLLIHTTNRHMNLWPLIGAQAHALGWVAYGKQFQPSSSQPLVYESFWVIIARNNQDIAALRNHHDGWQELVAPDGTRLWTDQYMNILPYLHERAPRK